MHCIIRIGVCTNQWKPLEMKEVTNCTTYNYTKIKMLMNEVWHASYIQNVYYFKYIKHNKHIHTYIFRVVKLIR